MAAYRRGTCIGVPQTHQSQRGIDAPSELNPAGIVYKTPSSSTGQSSITTAGPPGRIGRRNTGLEATTFILCPLEVPHPFPLLINAIGDAMNQVGQMPGLDRCRRDVFIRQLTQGVSCRIDRRKLLRACGHLLAVVTMFVTVFPPASSAFLFARAAASLTGTPFVPRDGGLGVFGPFGR